MINDNFEITGALAIAINGEVVKEVPNTVVTTGKEFVASRMLGTTANVMSDMAIGTGSTAVAASDTTLGTEADRVTLSSSALDANYDNKAVFIATFGAGDGTGAITEAGIFNASSNGDMLCRTVFDVVNKGSSDSMTITWTITVS